MFKFLGLGGPDADKLLGSLPADPSRDALKPIMVSRALHEDERAFVEIPADWYRFRTTRRHGGVSVRVAPGAYFRSGSSRSDGPQPTLISNGSSILTSHRIMFIGTAKSMSVWWEDVSGFEYGRDYVLVFRDEGDSELLTINEALMTWKDSRLGKLFERLQNNWFSSKKAGIPLQEFERVADGDQANPHAFDKNLERIIGSSTLKELEDAFRQALHYLNDNARAIDEIDWDMTDAGVLASKRLIQMVIEDVCDEQTAGRLWQLFGQDDDAALIRPGNELVINMVYDGCDDQTAERLWRLFGNTDSPPRREQSGDGNQI